MPSPDKSGFRKLGFDLPLQFSWLIAEGWRLFVTASGQVYHANL